MDPVVRIAGFLLSASGFTLIVVAGARAGLHVYDGGPSVSDVLCARLVWVGAGLVAASISLPVSVPAADGVAAAVVGFGLVSRPRRIGGGAMSRGPLTAHAGEREEHHG